MENEHIRYMRRAIELAKKGIGAVNPNPLVGAVIVKNGKIIGEGYHAKYGELHAERHAFAHLTESAENATMYVTLEPCCHYGKQPPCVEAIVEHKIAKVYVGSDDPNEMVSGKGYAYLREHGIEVETHFLKEECDALNPVFFHYITKKTPYIVMKYGMTMDGKIAAYTGASQWITNETSRMCVQEMRNAYVGIMVGIGTVLADNPMLTCRLPEEEYPIRRNPIRIVCDTNLRIPMESKLVQTAKMHRTIVACGADCLKTEGGLAKKQELEAFHVEVLEVNMDGAHLDLKDLLVKLGDCKIDGILLEGGGTLNYEFVNANLVDEIYAFIAPMILGGKTAITPVEGQGFDHPDKAKTFRIASVKTLGEDLCIRYVKNQ